MCRSLPIPYFDMLKLFSSLGSDQTDRSWGNRLAASSESATSHYQSEINPKVKCDNEEAAGDSESLSLNPPFQLAMPRLCSFP